MSNEWRPSEEDLDVLRAVAQGRTGFGPQGDGDSRFAEFEETGDRILDLGQRQLLDIGPMLRNHMTARGKYARIHVNSLTPLGRRLLEQYETGGVPDKDAQIVQKAIIRDFEARREPFEDALESVIHDHHRRGALTSGFFLSAADKVIAKEFHTRAAIALDRWRSVAKAQAITFTPALARLVFDKVGEVLMGDCTDIEGAYERVGSASGGGLSRVASLETLRRRALDRIHDEIEFDTLVPREPGDPKMAGPDQQFVFHGPVGVVAAGPQSTGNVTMNLGGDVRDQLVTQFEELRSLLRGAPVPAAERQQLEEAVSAALAEVAKPAPNVVTLRGVALGIATTVQTIGALPGAYEVAKKAALLLGVHLP